MPCLPRASSWGINFIQRFGPSMFAGHYFHTRVGHEHSILLHELHCTGICPSIVSGRPRAISLQFPALGRFFGVLLAHACLVGSWFRKNNHHRLCRPFRRLRLRCHLHPHPHLRFHCYLHHRLHLRMYTTASRIPPGRANGEEGRLHEGMIK